MFSELKNFETLSSLCKRRGYIFQSAEIYGGLNACWDYGPLGSQLKKNVADHWWKTMVSRSDVVGLDSALLSHHEVLQASGHVDAFTDPLVDCLKCKYRFRPEKNEKGVCPKCGSDQLTSPRPFNLMFKTYMGSLEDQGQPVYLRPETAQGIYVNFLNVQQSTRKKIPFGIAQIGKAFRNEITPGPFTFRTREFEQMEMQYFISPDEGDQWFEYWKEQRLNFYKQLKLEEKIRFHEHQKDELAHYAHKALDIEFKFPIGWKELEGIHDRGCYDLSQHQKHSKKSLEYSEEGKKFIPAVIETSVGLDRLCLALLCASYKEEKVKDETRVVLALPRKLAPVNAAILPLSKKPRLTKLAQKVRDDLSAHYIVDYDEAGSIGKRYRRQDEIGTPFSVTVDFESLEDQKITIRDRDTMTQERIPTNDLAQYMGEKFSVS